MWKSSDQGDSVPTHESYGMTAGMSAYLQRLETALRTIQIRQNESQRILEQLGVFNRSLADMQRNIDELKQRVNNLNG